MKKQEMYHRSLYFTGEGTYSLIEQAEAIMKHENISFNVLVRSALEEFVLRHGKGNNSFQLDKFGVTWTKAVSTSKCVFKDCKSPAVATALDTDKNQTVGLCRSHFLLLQDSRNGVTLNSWGGRRWTDFVWCNGQTKINNNGETRNE